MVKVKELINNFASFTLKKTIVATAVGLSMGTAFNKIVSSFVADLVMPLFIAYVGIDKFKNLKYVLIPDHIDSQNIHHTEVALHYGNLMEAILNFIIVSLGVFIFYMIFNKIWKLTEEESN